MITAIELLFFAYFGYFVTYNFILSVAGAFYKNPKGNATDKAYKKFAIFMPAYKEDAVIVEAARMALQLNYPKEHYDVVIIGDSLRPDTIQELKKLPVTFIEVSFAVSTKVKALNQAFAIYQGNPDIGVILDADNIMSPNFLTTLNSLHFKGIKAIQGRRAAKNRTNNWSFLDGLSEEINNHTLGKGSTALGLSSALKGSGMSFDYPTLKFQLSNMDSVGGFDRELELRLVDIGIKVYYVHEAVIFDEKVEQAKVFENQRTRWISSQYFYLRKYFSRGVLKLLHGDFIYFNSSVLRNLQLPRLLNLGILTFITIGLYFFPIHFFIQPYIWTIILVVALFSILIAIPREYFTLQLLLSVFTIPVVFFKMILIFLRIKGANKKFIHTPHSSSVSEKNQKP